MKNKYCAACHGSKTRSAGKLTNVKYNPDLPTPLRGATWPGQKTAQSGSKKK